VHRQTASSFSPVPAHFGAEPRRLAASRAAITFALANVPLCSLAVAFDWRTTLDVTDRRRSAARSFVSRGTALSGPVVPVMLTGALGLLAPRRGRVGIAATGALGVMGLLIAVNGMRQGFSEPEPHSPRAALLAGAVTFTAFGGALAGTSVRALAAIMQSAMLSSAAAKHDSPPA
jgi:hypothetical protein